MVLKRAFSNFTRIVDVLGHNKPGDELSVRGWVKAVRRLKKNLFLDVTDGTTVTKFQVVVPRNDDTKKLTFGNSVQAAGRVQVAPNGLFELLATDAQPITTIELSADYPFPNKKLHPPEYVREFLHLRAREESFAATMRVRHKLHKAIHDYMDEHGFTHISTPVLTSNDCEGAGEVFKVVPDSEAMLKAMSRPGTLLEESYFGSKTFLTVSGQLHLEAMTYGLGNTYCLGPAFRAENSKSPIHLAEFVMFEAEIAYVTELVQLTAIIQEFLQAIIRQASSASASDLQKLHELNEIDATQLAWLDRIWPTITYEEASNTIEAHQHSLSTETQRDAGFSKEQELFLVSHYQSPVFIVDWPKSQKPFYMKAAASNPELVQGVDLLMPVVGELCGGGLRESDPEILKARTDVPNGLDWYIEMRRFGAPPTAGFGMGFERLLQLLTGVKNIRDVIPFPRYPHSCSL